jgi:LuxR family maltose regulon positive regulatory protein
MNRQLLQAQQSQGESLYHMHDYSASHTSVEDTLNTVHSSVNDSIVERHPFLLEVQAWAAFAEGRNNDFEALLDKYYRLFPKIVVQKPRSALVKIMLNAIDYRIGFIDIIKQLKMIPFKGSIKAPTPSVSQNLPFFHRSFRDFSDFGFELSKNISLLEKTMGVVIGSEFAVMRECIYAGIYYETWNTGAAYKHALAAVANIPQDCSPEIRFCAIMILASVLYADKQDASNVLQQAEEMIEQSKAYYLNPNLQAYLCRLKLTNGDKDSANEWLKQNRGDIFDNPSLLKLYQHFTHARAYIVTGDNTNAILYLKKLLHLSERYRRTLDIIEARVLLAIVYWKKGRSGINIALEYMGKAVSMAYSYGYTTVFANEGAELVNMLHRMQKRSGQRNYKGNEIPAAFVKTLYINASMTAKRHKGLTGGSQPVNPAAFTDKQKTVMRLMCEGYNRNEIAAKIGLKPNGVKSHTELIYKKLDVLNSLEAVLKIKELSILDEQRIPEPSLEYE